MQAGNGLGNSPSQLPTAPAVKEVLRRRRRTYFIDRLIAAFLMSSATAFGWET